LISSEEQMQRPIDASAHAVCQRNDPTDNKNNTDDDAVSETPYTSDVMRGKFRNAVVRPADEVLYEPFQADHLLSKS